MVIYFARTDITSDMTKWFATEAEAISWAQDHYSDFGIVCSINVSVDAPQAIVDVLNGEDLPEVKTVWEVL